MFELVSGMAFPDDELLERSIAFCSASCAKATAIIAWYSKRAQCAEGRTIVFLDYLIHWRWGRVCRQGVTAPVTLAFVCRDVTCKGCQILGDCDVVFGIGHGTGGTT